MYFWGISFCLWILLHVLFEWLENTAIGIKYAQKIKMWPGGKQCPDSVLNQFGDTVFAVLGWLTADWLDRFEKQKQWYHRLE